MYLKWWLEQENVSIIHVCCQPECTQSTPLCVNHKTIALIKSAVVKPKSTGILSKYFDDNQMEYFIQDLSSNYSIHIYFYGVGGDQIELEGTIVLDIILQSD